MKTAVLRLLVKSGFVLLGILVIASGLQLMVRYQVRLIRQRSPQIVKSLTGIPGLKVLP